MKVQLLLLFLFGILNAFALTAKHEEESTESSDQPLKFSRRSYENCGLGPRLANRIIKGKEAKKHTYRWMASIRAKEVHFCGGSLISPVFVLTAGHCFNYFYSSDMAGEKNHTEAHMLPLYYVVLGDHLVKTTEPEEQIFGIDRHMALTPNTNRPGVPLFNDLALIRLNGTATINQYVSPICLPNSPIDFSPGNELTVSGWGQSKRPIYDAKLIVKFPEKFSNVLKVAQMKVIAREDCANIFYPKDTYGQVLPIGHPVGEDMICTREDNGQGDTATGDSGSPLMYQEAISKRWIIVGVLSFGWGRSGENAYASVSHFLKDIEEMKKELSQEKK